MGSSVSQLLGEWAHHCPNFLGEWADPCPNWLGEWVHPCPSWLGKWTHSCPTWLEENIFRLNSFAVSFSFPPGVTCDLQLGGLEEQCPARVVGLGEMPTTSCQTWTWGSYEELQVLWVASCPVWTAYNHSVCNVFTRKDDQE